MDRLPLAVQLRLVEWVAVVDKHPRHIGMMNNDSNNDQEENEDEDESTMTTLLNLALINRAWNNSLTLSRTYNDFQFFNQNLVKQVGHHVKSISCTFGQEDLVLQDTNVRQIPSVRRSMAAQGQCSFSTVLPHLTRLQELALEVDMFGDEDKIQSTFDEPLQVARMWLTSTIKRLSIVSMYLGESTLSISPKALANHLKHFIELEELRIVGVSRGSVKDEILFNQALIGLTRLKTLELMDCECIGPRVTWQQWQCQLQTLSIKRCNRIDLIDLEEWTKLFKHSLKNLTIHHYNGLDDESVARFGQLEQLQRLELESVFPILHLRCFIPCQKTLQQIKLGTAIRPWKDEDGEGAIFVNVLQCLKPALRELNMLQGNDTWGHDLMDKTNAWCRSNNVKFRLGPDSDFENDEEDEDDDNMSEEW
ncbi:hypothetical protein OIO90_004859 [Microbotryomycetes sp. JL221]|nr:hypothetical protein OIO90_004859 [Microbotryomycetes sp. JL221]